MEKWKDNSASADEESTGAVTSLERTRAMFEQATNWSKTLKGLSDFTFMDLYTYLVSSHNITFDCESWKAFRSLKAYKYFADGLVRNVHGGHITANDLVTIKAHFSHVAALMFYLEDKIRQKDMHLPADTSSTG